MILTAFAALDTKRMISSSMAMCPACGGEGVRDGRGVALDARCRVCDGHGRIAAWDVPWTSKELLEVLWLRCAGRVIVLDQGAYSCLRKELDSARWRGTTVCVVSSALHATYHDTGHFGVSPGVRVYADFGSLTRTTLPSGVVVGAIDTTYLEALPRCTGLEMFWWKSELPGGDERFPTSYSRNAEDLDVPLHENDHYGSFRRTTLEETPTYTRTSWVRSERA